MWTNRLIVSLSMALCIFASAALAENDAAKVSVTVSRAVAAPLQAAHAAIDKRDWTEAREQLQKAEQASNKTPQDVYATDTLLAYVLFKRRNYAEAAPIYERLLSSPLLPKKEIPERTKALAEMYFQTNNYEKAVRYAKRYLEHDKDDAGVQALVGDSDFHMKDFKGAAATMKRAVALDERAQQTPPESWLRVESNAYYRLGEQKNLIATLKELVRYYQKPGDWRALMDRVLPDVTNKRILFGYRRLMFDLDILESPNEYEEAVFAALDAGVPEEAQRILERGKQVMTGPDSLPGHYQRLAATVAEQASAAKTKQTRLMAVADTASGPDDVLLGRIELSHGDYDAAVDALRQGIQKDNLADRDDARITLGIAYLKQGQKDRAALEFQAIQANSPWAGLAELWTLRAGRSFEHDSNYVQVRR